MVLNSFLGSSLVFESLNESYRFVVVCDKPLEPYCSLFVKLNEEGTIRFEWFIANDNKTVTFIERLKDETAAKERIKNHMDSHLAAEFPEVFDIKKLIVLGEIGPEIAETYAAFGAEIRTKVAGFS